MGKRSNELLQELSIEIRFHAYYHHQQQDVQKENKKDLYASEKIFSLVYILFILRKYHLFLGHAKQSRYCDCHLAADPKIEIRLSIALLTYILYRFPVLNASSNASCRRAPRPPQYYFVQFVRW